MISFLSFFLKRDNVVNVWINNQPMVPWMESENEDENNLWRKGLPKQSGPSRTVDQSPSRNDYEHEQLSNWANMVYESDFYTSRRPYSRPTITSYSVTVRNPQQQNCEFNNNVYKCVLCFENFNFFITTQVTWFNIITRFMILT